MYAFDPGYWAMLGVDTTSLPTEGNVGSIAPEDLEEEFRKLAINDEAACFIKYVDDKPIAFAQCILRHDYVEGTEWLGTGNLL